ncbi:afadin- and alpha-actinin-binding protein B isoform X2 [Sebastes fasciatus]|uniref:afadin- and alpha-actinin-binding protein B isoform X2 n=1 Tax=Sebastes fasciatus TaxID=394691 RepID=UPI003D9E6982
MASKFGQKRVGRRSEYSDSYLLRNTSPSPLNELSHSASWWADREEHREQGDSPREQLKEMDQHVARLQDMLTCERAKCTRLQLRCNQQEAELRRREQHTSRLKERVFQLTERPREKGPTIEVLNFPPGGRGKREQTIKLFRPPAKREEEALCLMLERREAELREAMKLRHSLTTLLHALRVDMEHTLSDVVDVQDEAQSEDKRLDQAERALGDHVTGGVVQSWRQVQRRLGGVPSEGRAGVDTDHDKLLARLETELKESQQLVRLQQQLLHDSLASPVTSELADSYFLEEWERLQVRSAELNHQRRTFERERQSFTDAAIRLSHEISLVWGPLAYLTVFPSHRLPPSRGQPLALDHMREEAEFKPPAPLSSTLPSICHTTAEPERLMTIQRHGTAEQTGWCTHNRLHT